VPALSNLRLTPEERQYLEKHCPYFHADYLDFVEKLQLDPANQVQVTFKPQRESVPSEIAAEGAEEGEERDAKRRKTDGEAAASPEEKGLIEMDIQGLWRDCILYEVPLMSICESTPHLRSPADRRSAISERRIFQV
jgi:nicotinate phosphoribosyltransferase